MQLFDRHRVLLHLDDRVNEQQRIPVNIRLPHENILFYKELVPCEHIACRSRQSLVLVQLDKLGGCFVRDLPAQLFGDAFLGSLLVGVGPNNKVRGSKCAAVVVVELDIRNKAAPLGAQIAQADRRAKLFLPIKQ